MRRFLVVLSALAVASAVASATFGDAPPITIDVSTAVTTSDPAGTDVTYSVRSHLNPAVDVTCTPEGGPAPQFTVTRHFDVGDTAISCTDGTNTADVTVTVTYLAPPPPDTTPPVVTVPGDITAEATSGSGAVVTFSATATDDTDPSPQVNCSPGSGSTFPLGQTTVSCTATDSSGNTSPASTFNVTVRDTTKPTLALPSNISVEADSSAGKIVTYSATAGDAVSGPLSPNCSPASGVTFPIGATTVNCTVSDGAGNSQTGSFTVTVTDATGPAFSSVPGTVTAEANGPDGAVVNYSTPTAVDAVDGPQPVSCSPAPHTLFPLGTTTVQCTAADDHGNTGSASFHVAVVDTTPPTLAVPGPTTVYATTPAGIPEAAPAFIAFRKAATADDIVDPHPTIGDNLGSFAEVGTHDVGFVARDASGNVTARPTTLTVLPMPPPGTPPLAAAPPAKLPPDVAKLQTFPGDGFVRLVWGAVPGAARYLVYRSENGARRLAAAGHGDLVYSGTATTYTDRGLKNGVEYRYVVVSEDAAGNQSAGVGTSAVPHLNLLRSPKDGARLKQPPKLVWAPNAEAAYYNVQLYRGQAKILSTWPVGASVKLKRSWRYAGRRYTLAKGVYRWYVWPGFGARAKVDYGELLGSKTFAMLR
jgi:hypothetical protein